MKERSLIFVIIIISSLYQTPAQERVTVRDMGIWTGIGIEHDFRESYELSFNQEVRLYDNSTKVDEILSEIGLRYEIDKNFRIGADLRYMHNRRNDNSFSNDLRYNLDLRFKAEIIDRLRIRYRLRYQQLFGNFFTLDRDNTYRTETNFRNKLQFDYSFKYHQIYIASDLFREYEFNTVPSFKKLRICIGDKIDYKNGEINLTFAYERDLRKVHPLHFFFIKLGYKFKTNDRK
jgi:hypothetical protein